MIKYSVFTKPWKTLPLDELAQFVHETGFDGVEFPVRPDFQVEPQNIREGLPAAAETFAKYGVSIYSVAGNTDEATIRACAEAGVPMIRTMAAIPAEQPYMATVADLQNSYKSLQPLLKETGVKIGVQNHFGRYVSNAMGLHHLLLPLDAACYCAVLDPSHQALCGCEPEMALDIIWPRLGMANLKSAYWRPEQGPEAEFATWKPYWTDAHHGQASWPRFIAELKRRNYGHNHDGIVCLTAEYSDEERVEALVTQDLAVAKALFAQ